MFRQFLIHPVHYLTQFLRRRVISWPAVLFIPLITVAFLRNAYSSSSCSAAIRCAYRSSLLGVGDALGVPQSDPSTLPSSTPAWIYIAAALGSAIVAAALVSWQAAKDRPGPLTVGQVLEASGGESRDRADLQAIITDRLARVGIQAPSTVPASETSHPIEQPPSKFSEVPGFVARVYGWLSARNTEKVGYRLDATLRKSDRVDQYGLTFVVTNLANGRTLQAETMWASSSEEVARRTAFRVAAVVANLKRLPRTGRSPSWSPSADALRHYEDAAYFIQSGRLDEAFVSCEAGLEGDPASLPLRYLLGTLHERFGHFLSAVDTYTAAINILLYDGTSFSRPDKAGGATDSEIGLARPGRPFGRRIVSDEVTQIMWRYAVALTFGHRWIERWLNDLRRSDGEIREAPLGYRKRIHRALSSEPAATILEELETNEMRYRTDVAKRFRGFFHVRYHWLMADSFPMLNLCVFGEHRQEDMAAAGPIKDPQPPRLTAEKRRMLRSKSLKNPHGEAEVREWIIWLIAKAEQSVALSQTAEAAVRDPSSHHMAWLTYLRSWSLAPAGSAVPQFHPPGHPQSGFSFDEIVTGENFSPEELAAGLRAIPDALRGRPADLFRDGEQKGASYWFSRQRVAMLTYRIAKDLLAAKSEFLSDDDRDRVGFLVTQLDLRFFFLRCAQEEMKLLAPRWLWSKREVWSRPFLSPQLVRAIQRGVTYRCNERICYLTGDLPERGEGKADHPLWSVIDRTTRSPRLLEKVAEKARGWLTGDGDWNLWYYQACLHAVVMEEPPELRSLDELSQVRADVNKAMTDDVKAWMRDNDEHARKAVAALNHAVGVSSTRGKTAIEAGISDWMFFRDPDLDRLRPHLRFKRWSNGLFETEEGDYAFQVADRVLHFRSKGRYSRPDRLARLASETFTIDLLSGPIQEAARSLACQAGSLRQAPESSALIEVWQTLDRDHEAWRLMIGLPRFIGNPWMRAHAWRRIHDVAGTGLAIYAIYPKTVAAFRRVRMIPMEDAMAHVNEATAASAADALEVARRRGNGSGSAEMGIELLNRASRRWWTLYDLLGSSEFVEIDITDADQSARPLAAR